MLRQVIACLGLCSLVLSVFDKQSAAGPTPKLIDCCDRVRLRRLLSHRIDGPLDAVESWSIGVREWATTQLAGQVQRRDHEGIVMEPLYILRRWAEHVMLKVCATRPWCTSARTHARPKLFSNTILSSKPTRGSGDSIHHAPWPSSLLA